MANIIGASLISKNERKVKELLGAEIEVDIAVVLPYDIESKAKMDLDYNAITHAVNDYIERYTIDSRIDEVNYKLSIPKLPDEEATENLKDVLTGERNEINTQKGIIHVDNSAITNNKVTKKFELSIEENVYLNKPEENNRPKRDESQLINLQQQENVSKTTSTKKQPVISNADSNNKLIIKSSEPQLYWENADSEQLYIKNADPYILNSSKDNFLSKELKEKIVNDSINCSKTIGSGLDTAMDTAGSKAFKHVKMGNNDRVYFKEYARGNGYYKIVGKLADKKKVIQYLGIGGKVLSYGSTAVQTKIEFDKAESAQEKGKVFGASVGKIVLGAVAGASAAAVTTTVLVAIAGTTVAPVTLVIIAGCSIVAATAASSAAEKYGEEWGGTRGEKAVEMWQNREKKK